MHYAKLVVGLALVAAPFAAAHAGITTYTDQASFDAATPSVSYGFSSVSDPNSNFVIGSSFTVGPAEFTAGMDNALFVLSHNYDAPAISAETTVSASPSILNVGFSRNVTGFGLNLMTYIGTTTPLTVSVNGATVYTGTLSTTPQFLGFQSTDAITSLSFSSAGAYTLDSTRFQVAGVPEPAAWAMMIGGIGVVGGMMRQRRRAVARLA